jgi:predicted PurR-regulated permease PerM
MTQPQPDRAGLHILLKLASLVIILAGIHAAADIIVQLLLALFFAIVLNPLVTWFIRRGVKRPVAIAIVVLVMLVFLTALIGVLAASVNEFMTMLPKYNREFTRKFLQLQDALPFLHLHVSPERMLQRMDSERVMSFATTMMTQLSNAMASIVLLVMTMVFMLFEVRHVPYKMRFALNNPQIHIAGLHRALKGVSHYLALKTLLSLWTGVIVWAGLAIMDIQFALMWGVLAFLLNYVPNIGSVLSAIPPMVQALLFNGPYEWLLVGGLFLVVHMVIGNILEPRMMGHRLGMSTLVVFLSLLIWGWLLGPVGMLLSVPLTSVCKIWMETTTGGASWPLCLAQAGRKTACPANPALAQVVRKIRRKLTGCAGDDAVIVCAAVTHKGDSRKLINHFGRIGRARRTIGFHQRNMIVLEADGFFRIVDHPAREEDRAMEQAIAEVDDQTHVSAGRLGPGDFINALTNAYNVSLLVFHPTVCHDTAMNTVVQRGLIFDINLVVPAVIVGINQMFADETAQIMFIKAAHNCSPLN